MFPHRRRKHVLGTSTSSTMIIRRTNEQVAGSINQPALSPSCTRSSHLNRRILRWASPSTGVPASGLPLIFLVHVVCTPESLGKPVLR